MSLNGRVVRDARCVAPWLKAVSLLTLQRVIIIIIPSSGNHDEIPSLTIFKDLF